MKAYSERPRKSLTAVLDAPMHIAIEERPLPEPGPRDVLVQVMAVGVCGSDIHFYEHGRIGSKRVEYPFVLGHECAGVVVAVGSEVRGIGVGARVAVEPGIACFRCEYCKTGRYNICPNVSFLSAPPVDGAFSQYIVHPEHLLHPIPEKLSFEEATLIEPLSVGIHACQVGEVKPGMTVVVTGLGPIGLTAVMAAKTFGASTIIASDIEPFRLELARRLGATDVVHAAEQSLSEAAKQATQGEGADIALDTTGHPAVLNGILEALRRGGRVVPIGFPTAEKVPIDLTRMIFGEIRMTPSYRYANTYPLGIGILASGAFDAKALLTDFYDLKHTGEALERARTNKQSSVKVIVYPNG